jgi:uncharacterized repeat protein (TIGR01451 family)
MRSTFLFCIAAAAIALGGAAPASAQLRVDIDGDTVVPAGQVVEVQYRVNERALYVRSVHEDWRCAASGAETPTVRSSDFTLVLDQVNPATEPGAVYRIAPPTEGGSILDNLADGILSIQTTSDTAAQLSCAPFRESFFSGDFENAFAIDDTAPTIVAPGATLTVPVTITNPSLSAVATAIAVDFSWSFSPSTGEIGDPDFRPIDGQMSSADPSVWQVPILWPGETASIELDYAVGAATPAGTVVETRVDGVTALDRAGIAPLATDGITHVAAVPVGNAELTLTKTGTLNDDDGTAGVSAGDTISYQFTVTNESDVTLTGIQVQDPQAAVSGGPIAAMEPGAVDSSTFTAEYTLTQADVDAGFFTNTATVTSSEGATAQDSDTRTFSGTAAVTVTVDSAVVDSDGSSGLSAGDDIAYTFTVANTGTLTLNNLTVTDIDPDLVISGGPIASLAPGASDDQTFSGTYAIQQADIDAGAYGSTASVGSDEGATDDVVHEQPLDGTPAVALAKIGQLNDDDQNGLNAGDTISYTFEVTNTGNVTLTDLAVSDSDPDVTVSGGPLASLAPGASDASITGIYTVTQADIDAGAYANTASVTTSQTVTAQASESVALAGTPQLALGVRIDEVDNDQSGTTTAGDDLAFTFTLTNEGNVTLNSLSVSSPNADIALSGGPVASLAPGDADSGTITATYTLSQSDVDNGQFSADFDAIADETSDSTTVIYNF